MPGTLPLSESPMKRIAILGSTGSIGKSTLKIVEAFPDRFSVVSLAAGSNVDLAFEQARRWHPKIVSMASAESADHLHDKLKKVGLGHAIEVTHGSPGTVKVATHPDADFVVSAIVGVAGLGSHLRSRQSRQDRRGCQQRVPGYGWRPDRGRGAQAGQAAAAHRQRAQCHSSMPAGRTARGKSTASG